MCRARKGSFVNTHPLDWAAETLAGTLKKIPQLDPAEIDDVVVGTATPANELCGNIARMLVNRAGLPESIPGQTLNRFCSSGLQAVATCAYMIMAGQADTMVAGGVEFMSSKGPGPAPEFANQWLLDHYPGAYVSMGITAENVAKHYGISRLEMDTMAVESHRKAYEAQRSGGLNEAIIPITVSTPEGKKVVALDEGIRPGTNLEACGALEPCFIPAAEGRQRYGRHLLSDQRRRLLRRSDEHGESSRSGDQAYRPLPLLCGGGLPGGYDGDRPHLCGP